MRRARLGEDRSERERKREREMGGEQMRASSS